MSSKKVENPNKASNRGNIIVAVAVITLFALLAGGFFLLKKNAEERGIWDMSKEVPVNLQVDFIEDDGIGDHVSFRTTDSPTHNMDLFEDPSCGFCAEFSAEHGQKIKEKVDEGELELNLHLLNFLDESTGLTYSDDTSAVIIELAKSGDADNAWRVYEQIYDTYPGKGDSPTMEEIIAHLKDNGIADEVIMNLEKEPDFETRIYNSNQSNTDALITTTNRVSTPTVFFDGDERQFDIGDDEYFNGLFR